MKKLVSLLSAAAMMTMLAVPASAALTYAPDEDGWYVISEMPSDAEIAAYAPTLATTATKLETEDDLKAISSSINKKYKSKLATHDIYKVTYDMADLGTFINAYDEDYNNSFFGLYNITIGFDAAALPTGYEVAALNYVLPNGATGAVGAGVDATSGILNVVYTADGVSYDKIFPALTNEEGIVVDAGTFKAEYLLAYPKTDEAVTLAYSGTKVVYQKNVTNAATTNVTCDDIVLGGAPAPVLADFTALNKAIADAEAVEADKYVSVEAVNAALAAAKAIDQAAETDQAKVDAAAKAINDAIAALELKPVASVGVANEVIVKPAASNPKEANTVGIKATATPANGGTFTKLTANLFNGSKDAAVVVYEGTAIDAVTTFGLNIMQVPAGVTITVKSIVAE